MADASNASVYMRYCWRTQKNEEFDRQKKEFEAEIKPLSTMIIESMVFITIGYFEMRLKLRLPWIWGRHPSKFSSERLGGWRERTCWQKKRTWRAHSGFLFAYMTVKIPSLFQPVKGDHFISWCLWKQNLNSSTYWKNLVSKKIENAEAGIQHLNLDR